MTFGPLLSVITPVHDDYDYLRPLSASLFDQGLERDRFEWIIVDDGSVEPLSKRCIEALIGPDTSNVSLARTPGIGPGGARNLGTSMARAKWLTYVDVDDTLQPGALASWLAVAEQQDADLVLTPPAVGVVGRIKPRLASHSHSIDLSGSVDPELVRGWAPYAKLYRRSFLTASGVQFGPSPEAEDLTFHVRGLLAADSIWYAAGVPRYVCGGTRTSSLATAPNDPESTLGAFISALRDVRTYDNSPTFPC